MVCAELAAIAAILGRLPSPAEYLQYHSELQKDASDTYRYLNFHEIKAFTDPASGVDIPEELKAAAKAAAQ